MTKGIDKKEVGQRIKRIRLERGYTQSEFAKVTGSTLPAVSNWETGKNLPNKKRLSDVAFHGQVSVNELLTGKKETAIDSMALFNQQNDIRQYLSIDVDDAYKDFLIDSGISYQTIQNVINQATIYVNMSELPEEITVIKNI